VTGCFLKIPPYAAQYHRASHLAVSAAFSTFARTTVDNDEFHTVRAGLNYHFGTGSDGS
jgi:hypothetical protein